MLGLKEVSMGNRFDDMRERPEGLIEIIILVTTVL
jgi:hypothetical protein